VGLKAPGNNRDEVERQPISQMLCLPFYYAQEAFSYYFLTCFSSVALFYLERFLYFIFQQAKEIKQKGKQVISGEINV